MEPTAVKPIAVKPTAVIVACVALLVPALCAGQEAWEPFAIPGSRVVPFTSQNVGADFELHVASSAGEEIAPGLPLLVLLDSNEDFPLVTAIARRLTAAGELPPMLIVGVGYPEHPMYYRSRDYTPSEGDRSDRPSGGAAAFARFLADELIPRVEREFSTNRDRALAGHSLGGLFALWFAAEQPGAFGRILASSPSVWWGDEEVLDRPPPRGVRIYTSLGSEETELMTASWSRLRGMLPAATAQAELFDGEGHASVKAIAYTRGLRWLFGQH